ncbi:MAG: globin [Chloroflexi bacterium]|nr:globin [Chloroflexota bacterium]NOG62294.1 globin [Chloroflexota bacterium]
MAEITPGQVYDIIGSAGFEKLVAGFYRRVATDDVLRPMYPEDDLEPARRRLQLFLEQFFGGPTTYSQERGHPRLRMRHAPFKIDQAARNRWVELMIAALDEVGLDPEVAAVMRDYFENGASFLINSQ